MNSTYRYCIFFFNDTATTEIYTLSLHDALPIFSRRPAPSGTSGACAAASSSKESGQRYASSTTTPTILPSSRPRRSEEHTSELQSRQYLVCRLLLEKKKK